MKALWRCILAVLAALLALLVAGCGAQVRVLRAWSAQRVALDGVELTPGGGRVLAVLCDARGRFPVDALTLRQQAGAGPKVSLAVEERRGLFRRVLLLAVVRGRTGDAEAKPVSVEGVGPTAAARKVEVTPYLEIVSLFKPESAAKAGGPKGPE